MKKAMIHDKQLLQRRFSRHLRSYDTSAVVQRTIADRIGGLLEQRYANGGRVRCGVEIGSGTGFLTRHLVRLFPEAEWTANDLTAESGSWLPGSVRFEAGDGERFAFPDGTCDLIASASVVQWFDDLPGFIARAAKGLRPQGGVLALGTFGPENLREIAGTTGRGLHYYPLESLRKEVERNGLRIAVAEEWIERQLHPTPADVLRHLRLTGVNGVAAERWTRDRLRRFEADYRSAYTLPAPSGSDGEEGVTLTFHPIILIAERD